MVKKISIPFSNNNIRFFGFVCALVICMIFICSFFFVYTYNIILLFFVSIYVLFFIFGKTSSKYFFASTYFIFVSFYIPYTNVLPFVFYFGGLTFLDLRQEYLAFTYIYAFRFYLCILLPFFIAPEYFIVNLHTNRKGIFREYINNIPCLPLVICSFLFLCERIITFVFFGGMDYYLSGSTSRVEINTYLRNQPLTTFTGHLQVFFLVILILKQNLRIKTKFILFSTISFNYLIKLFMGGRKDILFLMVVVFLFYVIGLLKIKKSTFAFIFVLLLGAIFYRSIFMDKLGGRSGFFFMISHFGGEFIFPQITFPLSLQLNFSADEFNYPTLFDSFLYFIPRGIFPIKNYSIDTTFSKMMDTGMGFASTPLLESYLNFGEYGYIFSALLLVLIFRFIAIIFNNNKNYIFYVFVLIYLIDLNRGEISHYIRQLIEVTVVVSFVLLFLDKRVQNYSFRISWRKK